MDPKTRQGGLDNLVHHELEAKLPSSPWAREELTLHALREASRLEPLIALISVVGVRLLQLKTVSRQTPQQPARDRIPSEWLSALKAIRPRVNTTTLTVYQFFRELAKLGGFLARKHDGEPGWQTVWKGFRKLQNILLGINIANKKCG